MEGSGSESSGITKDVGYSMQPETRYEEDRLFVPEKGCFLSESQFPSPYINKRINSACREISREVLYIVNGCSEQWYLRGLADVRHVVQMLPCRLCALRQ